MSKSINISTSLRQTINDTVDLSSCVSATDWNEENIELDTEASTVSFSMDRDEMLSETFDELLTQDKHIIGAINEVFQSGVSVKQQLVDALIAKGIEGISTSDSFEILIGKIADI